MAKITDPSQDEGGLRAARRKLTYVYRHLVQTYVRPYTPLHDDIITLNEVEVPIHRSFLDSYAPWFQPATPTADNPSYEASEIDAIRRYCRSGDRVVVVGGGLGVTAVVAAQTVGENGSVTVFEPCDETVQMAARTVAHNGLSDRVRLVHAAIGSPHASCFTYRMRTSVPRIPCAELPEADVYEIDCEGGEVAILKQMTRLPRVVLVETHDNHDRVVQILRDRGFAIDSVVDDREPGETGRTHVRAVRTA